MVNREVGLKFHFSYLNVRKIFNFRFIHSYHAVIPPKHIV